MQNNVQQQNLDKAEKRFLSKFDKLFYIAMSFMVGVFIIVITILSVLDSQFTKREIQAARERIENSPQMQKYRADQERLRREQERQNREMARQKRLRRLGIDNNAKPTEKDDLLNQKLREQAQRQEQEQLAEEQKNIQGLNYSAELAAYNAKLQEVQIEEQMLIYATMLELLIQQYIEEKLYFASKIEPHLR